MSKDYSYVYNAHPSFIESLYAKYKSDPLSVEEGWRVFFEGFDFAQDGPLDEISETAIGFSEKEFSVLKLITGFRNRGHLLSTTNPIKKRRDRKPHLGLEDFGFTEADLEDLFETNHSLGMGRTTLRKILNRLEIGDNISMGDLCELYNNINGLY